MEFRILGPLEARDGQRTLELGGARQRALLAILLVHANQVVSSERLIEELWGEEPPETARSALRVHIAQLRKALPPDVLVTRAPGYVVQVAPDQLDLELFEQLVERASRASSDRRWEEASRLLAEAIGLWRGPPLSDFAYESWAQSEIARLEELRLVALTRRIDVDLALGRHAQLVGELGSLIAEHPLQERLRGQLMLALYRSGRQAEALDVYQQTRKVLVQGLGIEPSPSLQELERAILQQDAALELGAEPEATARDRQDLAAQRTQRTPVIGRTNLPTQPTPFLGRERELAEVLALLGRDEVRLLTLTGPGGIGKTRLALRAAEERAGTYRDGVLFVALAPIRDPELIADAVIQALRVATQPGLEPAEQLRDYLAERELLLLLDNLEQFPTGAPLLGRLLSTCPSLTVLAISREPLRLAGEHEYSVPPLDESEAVQLFVERARAVRPDFPADGEVAEICRRLDAVPLAVELAAARVRSLSPRQILARLDKHLSFLTGGPRDAPERQRTLRATVDWSHDLLSAEEQALFARLAVFSGGCTLAAAETVCEADLDTLQSLVEKSLVRRERERYLMLETIHEYALEQLGEDTQADSLRERHADCFLELAERAAPKLRAGRNDHLWLATLEADRDNLRSALAWLIDRDDGERAQRLACALFPFWHDVGPVSEARGWFEQALAQPSSRSRRAATLSLGSLLACYSADYGLARAWAEEGLALARGTTDHIGPMAALISLGSLSCAEHRREEGVELFEEGLTHARDSGDEWAIGVTLVTLLSHDLPSDAARREALAKEGAQLRNVGTSTRSMLAKCRGALAEQRGAYDEAAALYRASIAVAREIGFDKACASMLDLGWLTVRQGDFAEAHSQLREGVALALETGARGMAAGGIAYLALLAVAEGDPLRAAALAGAIDTYRHTVAEVPLSEVTDGTFDRYLDEARASADDDAWVEAFEGGRAMSLDAAARYALESVQVAHLARAR
jgi:predicted ATPase/DNA-binding SARP family transcriptional activator